MKQNGLSINQATNNFWWISDDTYNIPLEMNRWSTGMTGSWSPLHLFTEFLQPTKQPQFQHLAFSLSIKRWWHDWEAVQVMIFWVNHSPSTWFWCSVFQMSLLSTFVPNLGTRQPKYQQLLCPKWVLSDFLHLNKKLIEKLFGSWLWWIVKPFLSSFRCSFLQIESYPVFRRSLQQGEGIFK